MKTSESNTFIILQIINNMTSKNEPIDTKTNEDFEHHMYLMRTNGKYCLMNTNYDCVFVVEPGFKKVGFMMSGKKAEKVINKLYKRFGQEWCFEHKQLIYEKLSKDLLFTLTFDEWKKMTKPKPIRAMF